MIDRNTPPEELVANKHDVDLDEIRAWSEQERELEKFVIFRRQLSRA